MGAEAVLGQIAAPVVGGVLGNIFGQENSRQEFERTKELQDRQNNYNEEASYRQYGLEMKKWNETNYEAQIEHMKAAGLNPAMIYGGVGGGGMTSSNVGSGNSVGMGNAPSGAAQTQAGIQGAMLASQAAQTVANIELTKAQTEKTKAEAGAIPTTVAKTQAETSSMEMQNAITKAFGIENAASVKRLQYQAQGTAYEKQQYDWEAEKHQKYGETKDADGNIVTRAANDDNAPINKQVKSIMEKTQVDLEAAKLANDTTKAVNVVKEFEAEMARNGIAPNTPWYAKFVIDLLEKIGMNPLKMIQ